MKQIRKLAVCVLLSAIGAALPSLYGESPIHKDGRSSNRRVTTPPPETQVDPPVEVNPLEMRATSPGAIIRRATFTSVQVNVNASGNNIVGDAANEPSLTISKVDPNKMAIAWRQFDTINSNFRQAGHAYSTDGGLTWTFPGVVQPGQFRSDPVLGSDGFGNFYWSSLSSTNSAQVFKSMDGGITWNPPTGTPAFGGDKQWLVVDKRTSGMGAGHIYEHWNVQFSCCPPNDITRSIDFAASFQSPVAMPQPSMKWGTNDVAVDGTLYVAGSTLNQDGHLVTRSSNARDPDVSPTFDFVTSVDLGGDTGGFGGNDPNPGGLLGQVWIATDPTNVNRVYMLGSVSPPSGNPIDVHFVRSVNKGQTWSTPITINDDGVDGAFHWFGTLSVAPNGRIDVVWNDTRHGTFQLSETYYSFSVDNGYTWSPNVPVTPQWNSNIGWPQQSKIGDYYHMISDNAGASLAFAATFNGEQDVYFLRIPADCNNNGIPDSQDVLNGALDCNHNQIPDTCEPDADCNNNGIQDICDIANGTSTDCNMNNIPDSCEFPGDCNNNGQNDMCEIAAGTAQDCNSNGNPDECDIASHTSADVNGDSIPDECEGACCLANGVCSFETSAQCSGSGNFRGLGVSCGSITCGVTNDDCANALALPISPTVSQPFDNTEAFLDGPSPVSCDNGSQPFGPDLWYTYVAPCTGSATFSLCNGTNFDTLMVIYGGSSATCSCPPSAAQINCNDDGCGAGGGASTITRPVTGGMCYLIRAGGWNGSTGTGNLLITYSSSCNLHPTPVADPSGVNKNRYISFSVPSTGGFDPDTAIRVTLVSLQHPNPPNSPAFPPQSFGQFEGQVRYVGPPGLCPESDNPPSTFHCATLQCEPNFVNYSAAGLLHVTGYEVIPSSSYQVQTLAFTCDGNEEFCPDVSPSLTIKTARWADVAAPFQGPSPAPLTQPNVTDIAAIVDKFRDVSTSLIAQTDLQPDLPNMIVNITDVADAVTAFKTGYYPYNGLTNCPGGD
ncbi:MAG: exo-alpha-sialidase [Planctomycetes bacterium]|nr:exo-alpha-sialidase [Planctomycetota bacterium]MBI3836169.1 exo-alpha-sialidase [Planctomycetota bacterium]